MPAGIVMGVGDVVSVEVVRIEHERGRIGLGWGGSNLEHCIQLT